MSGVWPQGPPIPVQQGRSGQQPFQAYQGPGPGQASQEQQQQQQQQQQPQQLQGFNALQGGFPTQGPPKPVPSGGAGFPLQRGGPQYAPPPSGPQGGAIAQSSPPMGGMSQSIPSASMNAASPHTAPPMYRSPVPGPGPGSALSNRPVASSAPPSSHPGPFPVTPQQQQQQYGSPLMGGPPSVPGGPMASGIGPGGPMAGGISAGRQGAPGSYQQLSHPNILRPSSQPAPSMGPPPTGAPPPGPPPTGPPLSGPPVSGPSIPPPSGPASGPPPTAISAHAGPPRPHASPFMAPPGPPPAVARGGTQTAGSPPTTGGPTGLPARYPGVPQQPPTFLSAPGAAPPIAPPSTGGSSPPLGPSSSFDQRGYLQAGPYGPSLVQTPPPTVSRALSQPPPQYTEPYTTAAPSAGPYGQPTSAVPSMGPYGQPISAAPSVGPYGQPTSAAPPLAGPYGQPTSAAAPLAGPYGQPTAAAPSAGPYGQPTSTGTGGGGYYQGAGQYGYGPMQRQALIEDFQSLSITPPPGSLDAGVDPSLLPRPLDDDESLPQSLSAVNCHPKFMRLTCNAIPNSQSLRARWHLPLGAFIHPLAKPPPGEEVPIVNFGSVIVRCRSCRTYINPFVNFTDGGRRWRCNICGLLNEVPAEYFCQLGPDGRRRDLNERPELLKGCVEFVAPQEYMVRAPMPPVYFFLIDVSQPAVVSGMLQIAVDTIKASLDKLPGDIRVQIGFLTFDSTLHFINLKASLSQPQMLVVADLEDPFLPIPDDLLVNLSESRNVVEALLSSLPSMYQNTTNIEAALGPALQVTYSVMSQLGGKLLVFQSSLPSLGVGRLKLRGDDYRIYGTDREHFLRVAEDQFYKRMAADCYRVQISVNMYCFSDRYTDIASLGTLAKYTGGQVFYYPAFFAERDGERFRKELTNDLVRETGWEAVMRIRCGKGLRISSYHGHFFIRSSDLLALPAVDSDKACVVQISHDDTILSTPTTYLQSALLYTASCGERRIRVHTSAVPIVDSLGDLYRAVDLGATVTALAKVGVERSYSSRLEEVRTMIQQKCVAALREYRSLYAMQHHTAGRMIFPETLRLLPLYVLALCKSPSLRGGFMEVAADERSFVGYELMTMSVERTLRLLYPSLRRVDDMSAECGTTGKDGKVILPPALTLVAEKLDPHGVYLVEDGLKMFLWVGVKASSVFLEQILEPEIVGEANNNMVLKRKENNVSKRLMTIVDSRRDGMVVQPPCIVVRPGDRWEPVVQHLLIEDRTAAGPSYMEWILSVHKQIQHKG